MIKDKIEIIQKDKDTIHNLANWMDAYDWEVKTCRRSGELERDKIKELSRLAIKILVNYI